MIERDKACYIFLFQKQAQAIKIKCATAHQIKRFLRPDDQRRRPSRYTHQYVAGQKISAGRYYADLSAAFPFAF